LRKKQDGFLDKDKTMDNVQEHSNHINAFFGYRNQFINVKADGNTGITMILKFMAIFDLERLRKVKKPLI
jgi:hypothetical protein